MAHGDFAVGADGVMQSTQTQLGGNYAQVQSYPSDPTYVRYTPMPPPCNPSTGVFGTVVEPATGAVINNSMVNDTEYNGNIGGQFVTWFDLSQPASQSLPLHVRVVGSDVWIVAAAQGATVADILIYDLGLYDVAKGAPAQTISPTTALQTKSKTSVNELIAAWKGSNTFSPPANTLAVQSV